MAPITAGEAPVKSGVGKTRALVNLGALLPQTDVVSECRRVTDYFAKRWQACLPPLGRWTSFVAGEAAITGGVGGAEKSRESRHE